MELANLIDEFPGAANQTRCFMHILNLVVKSIIRQFDLPNSEIDKVLNDATKELLSLAGNIEFEEDELSRDGEDGIAGEEDNVEGWIDERTLMDEEDLNTLDESVKPVRVLLTKVRQYYSIHNYLHNFLTQLRKTAFAIKDSTTIILPQWFATLDDCGLHHRMMPRDVSTRWNSTYDMLEFAVEYREALDSITGNQRMKLRQYELSEEDWEIATKLRDVLKVGYLSV